MLYKIFRLLRSVPYIIKTKCFSVRLPLMSKINVSGDINVISYLSIGEFSAMEIRKHCLLEVNGFSSRPNIKINISNGGVLSIGYNTYLESFSTILCKGKIKIGDNVAIGQNVVIVDFNHVISNEKKSFVRSEDVIGKIEIGNNVWIGAGSKILMNVIIGDGAIIGANSVVNKSIPTGKKFGGIPAKELGV